MVPVWLGKAAHDQIKALDPDRPISWDDYAMQHEVCPQQLGDIATWLRKCITDPG